ncbi:4-(cytidine 5'-diphospho)-2-C-methyl-D-erythritol kinase, partial [Acinetobacter soli]
FGSAQLTGTGACVFTEVTSDMNVNEIVTHAPCKAYVVHGLKQSPLCL